MDGIINVLKPPGMSSHDVVYHLRRLSGIKKCGHTGTLDPGAAGVLPVCLGKATRLARFVTEGDKTYRGELTLGVSTTTQDAFGEITERQDASHILPEHLNRVLSSFKGTIQQIPPMASAIKVNGKRLYELAREGQSAEVPVRSVIIYDIKIQKSWGWGSSHPRVLFDVTCSKGTYVRTLCADIGKALGCGAYMSFLLRSRVGNFSLEKAYPLEELDTMAENGELSRAVIPMASAVDHLPLVEIHSAAQKSVCSGATLYPAGVRTVAREIAPDELVQIQCNDQILGIYRAVWEDRGEAKRLIFKPEVVFGS